MDTGKTTALRLLAADRPACWLALAAADREVEVLSARIAAAIGAASPEGVAVPTPAIGASDRQSLAEGQAAMICESLKSRAGPTMLVLDDVDQLSDEDSASQFLSALCLQAPPQLHIVLSGRRLPSLGLGSASGRGELLELTAPDLAFTADETASLLVARLGAHTEPIAGECWSLTTGLGGGAPADCRSSRTARAPGVASDARAASAAARPAVARLRGGPDRARAAFCAGHPGGGERRAGR